MMWERLSTARSRSAKVAPVMHPASAISAPSARNSCRIRRGRAPSARSVPTSRARSEVTTIMVLAVASRTTRASTVPRNPKIPK
jgi:hypothetical protein